MSDAKAIVAALATVGALYGFKLIGETLNDFVLFMPSEILEVEAAARETAARLEALGPSYEDRQEIRATLKIFLRYLRGQPGNRMTARMPSVLKPFSESED